MSNYHPSQLQVRRRNPFSRVTGMGIVLVIFLCAPVIFQARSLYFSAASHLETLAAVIGASVSEQDFASGSDNSLRCMEGLRADSNVVSAFVYDRLGRVTDSYYRSRNEVERGIPVWHPTASSRYVRKGWVYHLEMSYPVFRDGKRVGGIVIVSSLLQLQKQLLITGVLLLIGVWLFFLAIRYASRRLKRSVYDPVTRLATTARRIAELGDYSVRVERSGTEEIGGLTDHFNAMLDAIQVRDSELHQHRHNLELIVEERTEELRRRRDEAVAASQAKTEFLANMSHEIRTPMNGVIGVLSLLRDAPLSREHRRLLETADRSAESLLHIINDILDFSKIDAGMIEFESIPFDVCDIVEEVTTLYADAARARRIELLCHVVPAIHCTVEGDPTRLRQILTNLISNAVKFTEFGRVMVTVEQIEVQQERELLRFAVRDSGMGIPESMMPRLFEKFTQADGSITRHFGGTGLGLSVCKQLVELQGGDIGAYSQLGRGTEFWFTLRYKMVVPADEVGAELDGYKVLIVSSSDPCRLVIDSYLTGAGAYAMSCQSLAAAIDLQHRALEQGAPFHAVIVDQPEAARHPQFDVEACRRLFGDRSPRLVLLVSGAKGLSVERTGDCAVVYLPVRRRSLIEAISGKPSVDRSGEITGQQEELSQMAMSGKVLLVDDEPINLNVACSVLRRCGLDVDTAAHGREAVEKADRKSYDVILMDIQMPEMSGYEAAELIRGREHEQAGPRTVIVALTANALRSTRTRCHQAGMDDFISKPIKPEMLIQRLRPWLEHKMTVSGAESPAVTDSGDDRKTVWDRRQALHLANSDELLLTDLIRLFLARQDELLQNVRLAITEHDPKMLDDAAHAYKGAVNHFCAEHVRQTAFALEMKGKDGNLVGVGNLLETLEKQSVQLAEALHQAIDTSVTTGGR